MNKKPMLAGMMLATWLSGCATVKTGGDVWFKEGATEREQEAALAAAEAQAGQAHTTPARARDIVIRNMTAQGWRLVSKDTAPPLKSDATRTSPIPPKPGTVLP